MFEKKPEKHILVKEILSDLEGGDRTKEQMMEIVRQEFVKDVRQRERSAGMPEHFAMSGTFMTMSR